MSSGIRKRLFSREGRQHLSTYAAEGLSVLGMVLAYRLASDQGKSELDQYVIVRRTVSFAFPLVLVGAVVGLTRFVALQNDVLAQRRYLRGALGWVVPLGLLLWGACALAPRPFAWFLFGDHAVHELVPALGLMVFGISLHAVAYSYMRGLQRMHLANLLQLFSLAIAPCVALWLCPDLRSALWATGSGWILAAAVAMLPHLMRPSGGSVKKQQAELLRFGLPRLPGDLAFGALLTVPVYIAARAFGQAAGAEIGFGTTMLNVAAAMFSPVALMLLPTTASQLAKGDHAGLAARIGRYSMVMAAAGVAITVGFELVSSPLLQAYLGEATAREYLPMSRLVFIGAAPFAYYIALRSVLDAYYHTPRNGVNLSVAFLILLIGGIIHLTVPTPESTPAIALVVALYYLGWATWRDVRFVRSELERLATRNAGSLNIVVVIPAAEGSGAYPFAYRQARALASRHQATVTFFHLDSRTSPRKLLVARRRFKQLLKRARPDVVLAYYGSVSSLFTVLSSAVPVVVSFQGSDLNRTPSDGYWRDLMGRTFSQLSAFFAAGIVCVSERLRDRLWWRNDEALVLPLGADLAMFMPRDRTECRDQLGWRPDERVVLFNGNNPAVKRLDIARQVIERVRAIVPKARLEVLQGAVPYDRMPVLLNAADVLLLCSDSEGSPSMVKEAMACGLPVVCNDVGDTAERLREVRPGEVVAQDADALAQAIVRTLNHGRRSNGRELAGPNGCDAAMVDAELMDYLRGITIHA